MRGKDTKDQGTFTFAGSTGLLLVMSPPIFDLNAADIMSYQPKTIFLHQLYPNY